MRKYFLIFVIAIVALEITLRLAGYSYKIVNMPRRRIDKRTFRILCIGESTTAGDGTYPDGPYPLQLEVLLNANSQGVKFQAIYDYWLGVNSSKMLFNLPSYIKKYNPELIIAMIGANNWFNLDQSNILLYSENKIISKLTYKLLVFMHKFRLFKLIKFLYYTLTQYPLTGSWKPYDSANIPPHHKELYENILVYDLTEIVKICKSNNIKIVISGYPLNDYRKAHTKVAESQNIPFVDNWKSFKKLRDNGTLSEYLLEDNWHPNKKGYAIIANNIYTVLKNNRLIPISDE